MSRMQSVMNHSFSQVPKAEIPRSSFDRSHGFKTTFDAGWLIPVYVDEALPGDTFSLQMSSFARLATPQVPFMDNLYLDSFFFAVPMRLVWDNWQKFNGEQVDPGDSTDFLVPQQTSPAGTGHVVGSLSDFYGIPTGIPGLKHSTMWHRAYNLIWNEWFRDQNLQDSRPVPRDDGPDDPASFPLLRRGKRHDYFTSALPWPQKGPAVTLPLGTSAPVVTNNQAIVLDSLTSTPFNLQIANTPTRLQPDPFTIGGVGEWAVFGSQSGLRTDLSTAAGATINALRQAFQIQRLYERDARGGTRYTEIIRAHFGVTSPDARLQRPEYLGGGSTPINIHPIAQTSSTDGTTPQGNLAATGTTSQSGQGFSKSFTEHTLLLGFVSVRADLNYQQGLNRMFSRRTRWDFYWPALSHIGEQSILNKEIYAQGSANLVIDDETFGYQERYAEYRYKPSLITGKFRSTYAQSLDIWHLAQEFTSLPVLNQEFIVDNPPIARVSAVPSEPAFLFDSFFNLKTARPMPVYSVPGLIDHF
jgi:hypothetical protein